MAPNGGRGAPYGGVAVELTAAPDPATQLRHDRGDAPPAAHPPWLKPISTYSRREAREFACARFG